MKILLCILGIFFIMAIWGKHLRNAKYVYNFDTINEDDIFKNEKCKLTFEKQIVYIEQEDKSINFPVADVKNVNIWIEKDFLFCVISLENKQYEFSTNITTGGEINSILVNIYNGVGNYFKWFNIKVDIDTKIEIKEANNDGNVYESYFLGTDSLRKSDGNVQRGECEIIFEDDIFKIKQNEEIIKNPIQSIYYFDIWDYKDDTYFKFFMRSHTEYKFCSQHFEADKIAKILATKGIKVENNRSDDIEDE